MARPYDGAMLQMSGGMSANSLAVSPTPASGRSGKAYWILSGILVIATFLRLYHFTTTPPGLYPDEAIDGNNAAEIATTGHFQTFYVEDYGREGLYVNIVAVLLKIFPVHEPWIIRIPAAIAGILTVLGLYFLAREMFEERTALLASFLLATSVWHINFSRIGFRAILAPLLLVWAVYLLIRGFHTEFRSEASWYMITGGIVYGLGFYTYIAYRITPLLLLLFIPFFKHRPEFWKRVFLFVFVTFLAGLPIGWYFLKHPADFSGRLSQLSVTRFSNPFERFALNVAKTAEMFNFEGDFNWRHNLRGAPELFLPVGILFIFGLILGFVFLVRPRNEGPSTFALLLTFLWMAVAALPPALSDVGIPHALRSILMLPPAMLLAAIGGIWLYDFWKERRSASVVNTIAVLFVIAVAGYAYFDYFVRWAENPKVADAFKANYVTIGQEINALPANAPKYVVVDATGVMTRGVPMPAETTIFVTDTFLPEQQQAKNVHYLLPNQASEIPSGAAVFHIR